MTVRSAASGFLPEDIVAVLARGHLDVARAAAAPLAIRTQPPFEVFGQGPIDDAGGGLAYNPRQVRERLLELARDLVGCAAAELVMVVRAFECMAFLLVGSLDGSVDVDAKGS